MKWFGWMQQWHVTYADSSCCIFDGSTGQLLRRVKDALSFPVPSLSSILAAPQVRAKNSSINTRIYVKNGFCVLPASQSHGVASFPCSLPMACIYVDFSMLLEELSNSTSSSGGSSSTSTSSTNSSFPFLIISSLLSPPSTRHSSPLLLSCHIACTPTPSSSSLPLSPLLKNLTWGQASGGGGDVQRRRIAAATLACVHAIQALGTSPEGDGSEALLNELLCLVQSGIAGGGGGRFLKEVQALNSAAGVGISAALSQLRGLLGTAAADDSPTP